MVPAENVTGKSLNMNNVTEGGGLGAKSGNPDHKK